MQPIKYSSSESSEYLRALKEKAFVRKIVKPLLSEMGFKGIRNEHGPLERGKDLIFWKIDEFGDKIWYAAQVKTNKLSGNVYRKNSLRSIINQLQQALDTPFIGLDGKKIYISNCIFITSDTLTTHTRESIKGLLIEYSVFKPVKIIDLPELVTLISKYKPELLESWEENISNYCKSLESMFCLYLDYRALGLEEQPFLSDFYIDVNLLLHSNIIFFKPFNKKYEYIFEIRFPIEGSSTIKFDNSVKERVIALSKNLRIYFNKELLIENITAKRKEYIETKDGELKEKIVYEDVGIKVDYKDIAEKLSNYLLMLSSYEFRDAKLEFGFKIENLYLLIHTVKVLELILPDAKWFQNIVSLSPKKNYISLEISNKADPLYLFKTLNKSWLMGNAGTGKTTLCRYHTYLIARSFDINDPNTLIPVIISLSSYDNQSDSLTSVILSFLSEHGVDVSNIPLINKLEKGDFIVFLDGLDEIASEAKRMKFLDDLKNFEGKYPNNKIVISSRFIDVPNDLKSYVKIHTTLLNDGQLLKFCKKWFEKDKIKLEKLVSVIKTNETFRAIAKNPLYLTLIASLVQNGKPIPQRRVELYKERVDLLINKWDYSKGVHRNKFEADLKLLILKKLALSLHLKNLREFSYDNFFVVAYKNLPSKFRDTKIIKDIFEEILSVNALFRKITDDKYDYGHLSFQEFFVSTEINDTNNYEILKKHIIDDWWRQVCLMYCGLKRIGDELISFLIDKVETGIHRSDDMLFYAAEIIAEADWTSEPIKMNISNLLGNKYKKSFSLTYIGALLNMRCVEAYVVFFDLLKENPNLIKDKNIIFYLNDVAGSSFYKIFVEKISSLCQSSTQELIKYLLDRGTEVEKKYLKEIVKKGDQSELSIDRKHRI